ncbi:MAG: VIT1/CCC1 transporter family protein [Simkaniaceae bacterium]|nr:VIT1/CCC1 transporter family protein [Simkaniaceae bacterium]
MDAPDSHFQGKSAVRHLEEARKKGAGVIAEAHAGGSYTPLVLALGSLKEAIVLFAGLHILTLFFFLRPHWSFFCIFSSAWVLWKGMIGALTGWTRLDKLHRLIEEERYEIEHNRDEEREELTALYTQKGFSDPLLTQVIDVLMADDNRLLNVMIEEEFGVKPETFEHPLKQGIGSMIGALVGATVLLIGVLTDSVRGLYVLFGIVYVIAVSIEAKREGSEPVSAFVWNGAVAALVVATIAFAAKIRIGT